MKKIIFIISLALVGMTSCKNEPKQPSPEVVKRVNDSIVQAELSQIDMNDVDSYPQFEECKDASTKEEQKACFEKNLAQKLAKILSYNQFTIKDEVHDTIVVFGKISNEGKLEFEKTVCKEDTRKALPILDSVLRADMAKIPSVEPALKRGVQVNSLFKSSIVVNVK